MEEQALHKVAPACALCGQAQAACEPALRPCAVCGLAFESEAVCPGGHHVCHQCRQKAARDAIMEHCLQSIARDPYALMQALMRLPTTAMHGPEHHLLAAAAMLTALCNRQGRADLPALLTELNRRSLEVPGGACGNWGICGAAVSAGILCSLLHENSPFAAGPWGTCGQLTARCADRVSAQGGPRCCKRDSFIVMGEMTAHANAQFEAGFAQPDKLICRFYPNNSECKGRACPFFPAASARRSAAEAGASL